MDRALDKDSPIIVGFTQGSYDIMADVFLPHNVTDPDIYCRFVFQSMKISVPTVQWS